MNSTLILGTMIVTCALIFYSTAVLTEQRKKIYTPFILTTLTIGIILDVTATAFMIAGSRKIPFTAHGFLGYSALAGMLIDTILTWRYWRSEKKYQPVPHGLHLYTRLAYSWWVLAYLAGGAIAMIGLP
jgi:hypothetical protein